MGEMLTQGANYSHVPARRLVWLKATMPLLKVLQAFCSLTSIMPCHALQTLRARSIRAGDLASIMKACMIVLWSLCPVPGYAVSFWVFYSWGIHKLALLCFFCQLLPLMMEWIHATSTDGCLVTSHGRD